MATRQCAHSTTVNNSVLQCKNWVTSSDEDQTLCPIHAGVLTRAELSPSEKIQQQRYENHFSIANMMSNEQLASHIAQLEALLEDVRLRQQAAAAVKSRRIKDAAGNGELSEAQKAEIATLRGEKAKSSARASNASEPKVSKEEKSIQKMMKLGLTREKAIILLGFNE